MEEKGGVCGEESLISYEDYISDLGAHRHDHTLALADSVLFLRSLALPVLDRPSAG